MIPTRGVKSKADDPDESRRSWGLKQTIFWCKADDLFGSKQTIRRKQTVLKRMKADDLGQSGRSFSNAFLWIKADDPNHKFKGQKQTVLKKSWGLGLGISG